jgi:hypothetical protein
MLMTDVTLTKPYIYRIAYYVLILGNIYMYSFVFPPLFFEVSKESESISSLNNY